jgi:hypothetical protein
VNAGQFAVVVAAAGSAISIGTIIFLAGALKGAVSARLDNIEGRLTEIEHSMRRMGFTIRQGPGDT